MSLAPCIAWLAETFRWNCDVIKAPWVQHAFVYFFWSAQPNSITLHVLVLAKNEQRVSSEQDLSAAFASIWISRLYYICNEWLWRAKAESG